MIKALFITTKTIDCINHISAWESVHGKAEIVTFDHNGIRNDWHLLDTAAKVKPQVIFYIGPNKGTGIPSWETLRQLRKIAPSVNLCSDAQDKPWHPILAKYRSKGCFDLQVSIDGASGAPVDFATLTPVDTRPFLGPERPRDIRCGFSGSVGRWNFRSEMVLALEWFGGLTVRRREGEGTYQDHVDFLRRSRMLLNSSFTGTGHAHHIKGRVLEAGWAGCCLLESEGSPIAEWFPKGCWLSYRTAQEAAAVIKETDDATIEACAAKLSEAVRFIYRPDLIYGDILSCVGLTQPV